MTYADAHTRVGQTIDCDKCHCHAVTCDSYDIPSCGDSNKQGYSIWSCHCTTHLDCANKDQGWSDRDTFKVLHNNQSTDDRTCTSGGFVGTKCSHCGAQESGSWQGALGHNMGGYSQTTAPTCTEKGQEASSCSRCGHRDTRDIDPLGHAQGVFTVTTPATCTTTGVETSTCSRCSNPITRDIAALGHIKSTIWTKEAMNGVAEGHRHKDCTRAACGIILESEYLLVINNAAETSGAQVGEYYGASAIVPVTVVSTKTGYHIKNISDGVRIINTVYGTGVTGSFVMPASPVVLVVNFEANTFTVIYQGGSTNM